MWTWFEYDISLLSPALGAVSKIQGEHTDAVLYNRFDSADNFSQ